MSDSRIQCPQTPAGYNEIREWVAQDRYAPAHAAARDPS